MINKLNVRKLCQFFLVGKTFKRMDDFNFYPNDFIIKEPTNYNKSARAKQIHERKKLDSSNGNILDEHDQFYRDHKLLLKLFQVIFRYIMQIQK